LVFQGNKPLVGWHLDEVEVQFCRDRATAGKTGRFPTVITLNPKIEGSHMTSFKLEEGDGVCLAADNAASFASWSSAFPAELDGPQQLF
jgi:hypothetical protein